MNLPEALSSSQPLRKSAQRMRWFVEVFEKQVRNTETETGNEFSIDRGILARVFTDWLRAFEGQKPAKEEDKLAFVGFAAGLMLRTLIKHKPVSLINRPENADETNPAFFWPEGYLYVAFCLNVRGLVLHRDYHSQQISSAEYNEIRTWWSFRENVTEDPSLAIAFLDLFAGEEPDWSRPDFFRTGQRLQVAERFFRKDDSLPHDDR